MKNSRRLAIASVALVLGVPAVAQEADTAQATTTGLRMSPAPAPAYTTHASSSARTVLVPFGPYITQTGGGYGGADASELYTTFTYGPTMGYNLYGLGMQFSASNRLADDFSVPSGYIWSISALKWLCYQTGGSSTSGTITAVDMNLWDSTPTVVGAQWKTGGNVWISNAWTGVFRVPDSSLLASNRPIFEATCSAGWVPALSAGTYWLDASASGSLVSGPWGPVKVKAGQIPPTGDPWNGMQAVGGGAFAQVFDTGSPAGSIHEPIDFLFQLEGGGGGVGTFCTSKPSSIPGCIPSVSGSGNVITKGGIYYHIDAGPVPGGNQPGILLYTATPYSGAVITPFGYVCVSPFWRGFPGDTPGGNKGQCDGMYTFDFQTMVNANGQIMVGDNLSAQVWYRDPQNQGYANLTHGIGPVTVVQ